MYFSIRAFSASRWYGAPGATPRRASSSARLTVGAPTISTSPIVVRGPGSMAKTSVARSGVVLEHRPRRDRRVEVAALAQRVRRESASCPRRGRAAATRRSDRRSRGAARPDRCPGTPSGPSKRIAGDRMDRDELVAQRDAPVLQRRVDADAFEPAEAEQVRHRLAHLRPSRAAGRPRSTRSGSAADRSCRALRRPGARTRSACRGSPPPRRPLARPLRWHRGHKGQQQRDGGKASAPHQNTCLTRNSSA